MQKLIRILLDQSIQFMTSVHRVTISGRRARRLARLLAELIPPNKRILDIGSGNGRLIKHVLECRPDLEICGIDVKCGSGCVIPIAEYDGKTIPFDTDSWDICMANDVLHHCDDPIAILREMKRVAKESILIKDHIADTHFSQVVLGAMDWVGNFGYGTKVPFNFLSTIEWKQAYADLDLTEREQRMKLGLYPYPFTWLFDSNLHFVALLNVNK